MKIIVITGRAHKSGTSAILADTGMTSCKAANTAFTNIGFVCSFQEASASR